MSAGLRRFVTGSGRSRPAGTPAPPPEGDAPEEKCEMCAAGIPVRHGHVADLEHSSLLCTCRPCYLLFQQDQAGRGRYRAVPDRYLGDPDHPLTEADWDDLEIPVGLAFFMRSSRDGLRGFYPSPAGPAECRLDLGAWERIARAHPLLEAIESDVEAALVTRTDDGVEHFLVPIDACYELAGRMRMLWKGFDGGTEARQSVAEFLAGVRARCLDSPGLDSPGLDSPGRD
ncbi:MAG TPA: DUF5947 family protein [Streptosporangiaceae bacterium]|nr:DUF5947 family protein [Streptosporangiaceae bacterium]